MQNVSGNTFSKTITGQTVGTTISYGCKFAFAGGLAVTKYFSYVVGSNCSSLSVDNQFLNASVKTYPNPVTNIIRINTSLEINKVAIFSVLGKKVKEVKHQLYSINIEDLSNGLYLMRIYTTRGFVTKKVIIKR